MLVSKQNKDVYIDKLNDKLKTLTLTFPVLHKLKMRWNIILILQNVYNILRRFIGIYIQINTKKISTFYIEIDVKTYNRLC